MGFESEGNIPPEQSVILNEMQAELGGGFKTTTWGWVDLKVPAEWSGWYAHAYGPSGTWNERQGDPPFAMAVLPEGPPEARLALQLWVFRAGKIGSPIAIERRCRPDLPSRIRLIGLDQPHRRQQVDDAQDGIKLLGLAERLLPGGRYRLENEPDRTWIDLTRRAIDYHTRNRSAGWKAAAAVAGVKERQLRTWRKKLGNLPFTAGFSS